MDLRTICRRLTVSLAVTGTIFAAPLTAQSKQLDVVPSADLPNIDPVFASVVITRIFGMMVYEELFAWDNHLQPRVHQQKRARVRPPCFAVGACICWRPELGLCLLCGGGDILARSCVAGRRAVDSRP